MFREMLKLLTKTGKRDLIISSIFFALYGLSSIAMIVIVFSILFQIFNRTSLDMLYKYFIAIGLLVVFKGICNMVADMKKHSAGFDIVYVSVNVTSPVLGATLITINLNA